MSISLADIKAQFTRLGLDKDHREYDSLRIEADWLWGMPDGFGVTTIISSLEDEAICEIYSSSKIHKLTILI